MHSFSQNIWIEDTAYIRRWRIHIRVDNKETGSDEVHLLSIGTSDRLV
jgi:hypothetical protein